MENKNSSKLVVLTFSVLVLCCLTGFYIFAWTGPTAAPPSTNTSSPINTGSEVQTKQGNLTIGTATIKGDGSISTNLNSDKVDDLHAADLMAQAGGKVFYTTKCSWSCGEQDGCYSWFGYGRGACVSTCDPPSCASGYDSLGTGCAAMGGGAAMEGLCDFWNGYGYCERYCIAR